MSELDIADDVYPVDNISVKNKLLKMVYVMVFLLLLVI